jgi:pimeloyl-ACP methyl ester carboxylesterase
MLKQEIRFFATGNKNKKPIIFIHGFPFDHHMWDKQVSEFNSSFFCVTYDIRGLGISPAGDGQFTLESFVDDLEFLINDLGLNKPILCGLSMGGYIAFRSVERFENKLGGLILCDTKPGTDTDAGRLNRAEGIKKINKDGVQKFISGFVPNCFTDKFVSAPDDEYNEILSRALNFDPAGVKGCLLAMQGRTDVTSYLTSIQIPTFVVCGEEDKFTPPEVMKTAADLIKKSEFVTIPGAGHMSPVENPEYFNKSVLDFLKRNF